MEADTCTLVISSMKDANNEQLEEMFRMYVSTYSGAGQELWFKTPSDLQRYACKVAKVCAGDAVKAFLLYQARPAANKISLIVHDGTNQGKYAIMNLLVSMLKRGGFYIEAAGAVSWSLRKLRVPVLHDANKISNLLGIDPSKESIEINPDFDIDDKNSQSYVHKFHSDGVVQFTNTETLFMYESCTLVGQGCERHCILSGGRRKIKRKSHRI
jgi:hypothetical protein